MAASGVHRAASGALRLRIGRFGSASASRQPYALSCASIFCSSSRIQANSGASPNIMPAMASLQVLLDRLLRHEADAAGLCLVELLPATAEHELLVLADAIEIAEKIDS